MFSRNSSEEGRQSCQAKYIIPHSPIFKFLVPDFLGLGVCVRQEKTGSLYAALMNNWVFSFGLVYRLHAYILAMQCHKVEMVHFLWEAGERWMLTEGFLGPLTLASWGCGHWIPLNYCAWRLLGKSLHATEGEPVP